MRCTGYEDSHPTLGTCQSDRYSNSDSRGRNASVIQWTILGASDLSCVLYWSGQLLLCDIGYQMQWL